MEPARNYSENMPVPRDTKLHVRHFENLDESCKVLEAFLEHGRKKQNTPLAKTVGVDKGVGGEVPQEPQEQQEEQELRKPGFLEHPSYNNAGVPPADSGYNSIPKKIDEPLVSREAEPCAIAESQPNANDDTGSVYTEGPKLPSTKQKTFIFEFANDLFHKINLDQYDQEFLDRMDSVLPRLLKGFSLKFGRSGSTQMHRDVMVFIRKHSRDIAKILKTLYIEHEGSPVKGGILGQSDRKMELDEIMELWYRHWDDIEKIDPDLETDPQTVDGLDIESTDIHMPSIEAYRKRIAGTPEYKWLVESIDRELHLAPCEPNSHDTIRSQILNALPSLHQLSRHDYTASRRVTFILQWDPATFIREQAFDTGTDNLLGKIITITGTARDAQAMTCSQYINHIWPLYGAEVLRLVELALCSDSGSESRCTLPDHTELRCWREDTNLILEVAGLEDSVAEVGEQAAWLGAALRSSPYESKIYYCTPYIDGITIDSESTELRKVSVAIGFMCDQQQQDDATPREGQCWHNFFQNPTVVTGYPISRRADRGAGLEISLQLMAGLIQARFIEMFDESPVIKGFSSMLVPTKHDETRSLIMWHLLYNPDGNRISYLDNHNIHVEKIDIAHLQRGRHIVGWCSMARCYAGAANATYSIDRSWLPEPYSECILDGKSFTRGSLISDDDPAIYGNKDIPDAIIRDVYVDKLRWLSDQYAVLWDVGKKRGWLVNGTSALLHLLYTSFEFDQKGQIKDAFSLDRTRIAGPEIPYTSDAAMAVLLNPENLALELYVPIRCKKKDQEIGISRVQVQDRVESLYSMLEKMMDCQRKIMKPPGRTGGHRRDIPRKLLEGWDFKDLATFKDPMTARVFKLGAEGKGWVDFTRSICAITLFATGFGEIIKPVFDPKVSCTHWDKLPAGKSYLAVSRPDLAAICDSNGNPHERPIRLANDLMWYNTTEIPGTCQCMTNGGDTGHSKVVQVILPARLAKRLPNDCCVKQDWTTGAVVFGFNYSHGWIWPDIGNPERGDKPPSSCDSESESDDGFQDSGVGTSVGPVNSTDELSSADDVKYETSRSTALCESFIYEDYEVGIVCALAKELRAVRALFDRDHPPLQKVERDINVYNLGIMNGVKVVAAGLPTDDYGTNSATNVATHLIRTFPNVKFCLLVGIGGGVPSLGHDIRMGDVVVGTSVIQYDMGKHINEGKFQMTGHERRPSEYLRAIITSIQSETMPPRQLLQDVRTITSRHPEYESPGVLSDRLFASHTPHKQGELSCRRCYTLTKRKNRRYIGPSVFYGVIASGNQVMKDAQLRDRLARKNNVLCFEMEAAGVIRTIDCLVIRGICDYADSHKSKEWQEYAAATAAAYAKLFLCHSPKGHDPGRLPSTAPGGPKTGTICEMTARIWKKTARIWDNKSTRERGENK